MQRESWNNTNHMIYDQAKLTFEIIIEYITSNDMLSLIIAIEMESSLD